MGANAQDIDDDKVKIEHWRNWTPAKRVREAAKAIVPLMLSLEPEERMNYDKLRAVAFQTSGPLDRRDFDFAKSEAVTTLLEVHGRVIGSSDGHIERYVGEKAANYQNKLNSQIRGRLIAGQKRYGIALTDSELTSEQRRKIENSMNRGSFVLSAMEDNERLLNTLREARKKTLSGG